MAPPLTQNPAREMLSIARKEGYGIPAVCIYNLEGILATLHACLTARSPAMLLLFPWAQTYSGSTLARAAANAARQARKEGILLTVHLDHAQSPEAVKSAADLRLYESDESEDAPHCFDSIMVDMSHYPHEENLRLTADLTRYCHDRGIAVEAESGRIEGGEDGVSDTADLEGLMTTPEQACEFIRTGVDWLAPAFGNVHGNYGPRGIVLEYERLEEIVRAVDKVHGDSVKDRISDESSRVQLVLHGTDGFTREIYTECIKRGVTKCNINRNVNSKLTDIWATGQHKGVMCAMEAGTKAMQKEIELCMDWLGSKGRATT